MIGLSVFLQEEEEEGETPAPNAQGAIEVSVQASGGMAAAVPVADEGAGAPASSSATPAARASGWRVTESSPVEHECIGVVDAEARGEMAESTVETVDSKVETLQPASVQGVPETVDGAVAAVVDNEAGPEPAGSTGSNPLHEGTRANRGRVGKAYSLAALPSALPC